MKDLVKQGNRLNAVYLPHSKCATVTDRLYGQYDNLLIVCGDGELDFYGKGSICKDLNAKFEGWCGGDLDNSGFWGGYASPDDVKAFIDEALDKTLEKTTHRHRGPSLTSKLSSHKSPSLTSKLSEKEKVIVKDPFSKNDREGLQIKTIGDEH